MKPVVVYDDNCPACTSFGTWGRNIIALGYSTPKAKRLMQAQFGKDYGFALMIFTATKVYWGSSAAAEVTRQGYSAFFGHFFNGFIHFTYLFVVASLNFILRRKTLPTAPSFKSKKLPDSGSMPLTAKASEELAKVSSVYTKSS